MISKKIRPPNAFEKKKNAFKIFWKKKV